MTIGNGLLKVIFAWGVLTFCVSISPASAHAGEPRNAYCPVSPDEEIDENIHEEYQGTTIYFCCNKCRRKFLADPEKYAGAIAAVAGEGMTHAVAHGQESENGHADGGHEHAGEEGHDLAAYLGRLHPVVVHFPISFVLLACGAAWLSFFRTSEPFAWAARWITGTAAVSAIVAAAFGWLAAAAEADEFAGLETYVTMHRWLGVATAVFSIIAWRLVCRKKTDAFRIVITLTALLVTVAGYFGAVLVHGPRHLAW